MIREWINRQSLQKLLFIQVFFLTLLLTGVLSAFSLYGFRHLLMQELGAARIDVLKQVGERIETIHRSAEALSNLYYLDGSFRSLAVGCMDGSTGEEEKLRQYLAQLENRYRKSFEREDFDYFVAVQLKNGFRYCSPSGEGYDFTIPERKIWYSDVLEARGNLWWSKAYRKNGDPGAESLQACARAIMNMKTGEVIGTLFIVLPESVLSKTYMNVLNENNNIYILNEDGSILSHKDKKMVGINFYNMQRFEELFGPDSYALVEKSGKTLFLINSRNGNLGYTIVEETPFEIIMSPLSEVHRIVICVFAACIFAAFILSLWLAGSVVRPLNQLCSSMEHMQNGDLEVTCGAVGCLEVTKLSDGFNGMMNTTRQLLKDVEQKQEQKRKAELDFLQSQINPHFIYNTLFNIKCMAAMNRMHEVEDMITAFGKILENTLNTSKEMLPLSEEAAALAEYVHLLKYRYSNQFELIYNISRESGRCLIPKLTLQPIVENAIFHGIEPRNEEGTIIINSWLENGLLTVEIIDDGIGMNRETTESLLKGNGRASGRGHHIGLRNINERLKLFFGSGYGLKIESEEGIGTTVTIRIPGKEEENVQGTDCR